MVKYKRKVSDDWIDKIMSDGAARTPHQILDSMIDMKDSKGRKRNLAYIPQVRRIQYYLRSNKDYDCIDNDAKIREWKWNEKSKK